MAEKKRPNALIEKEPLPGTRETAKEILSLSGSVALNRILALENPEEFVRNMAHVDLYWVIKKIGEEDALPILQMASTEQWGFLLDLELWKKDRLDLGEASEWMGRLLQADPARLVRWLLSEGEYFTYLYLSKMLQVEFKTKDEMHDVQEGFITLDGIHYLKILDPEHEEVLRGLLQHLAGKDYPRYHAILLGLSGVAPAEVEEELYRRRNVRLSEDGFLPYEEAVSVYTVLKKDLLTEKPSAPVGVPEPFGGDRAEPPLMPILNVSEDHLMVETMRRSGDPLLLDRVTLEFAGLCSQVFSAEGVFENTPEALAKTVRKAAGYVNVGLERWCGRDLGLCEQVLKDNTLVDLFRSGFSLALEMRWETEQWLKKAWFSRRGFRPAFWEEEWGATLVGVVQKRPLLFDRSHKDEPYRAFESLEEIESCRRIIRRLVVLDRLLETLVDRYPLDEKWSQDPLFTFHSLLFNYWARKQLAFPPGFAPLSLDQVRDLFRLLRSDSPKAPFGMTGFRQVFVNDGMACAPEFESGDQKALLEETLGILWDKFTEEYALVGTADLDGRFLRFILSSPNPSSGPK
ncbi:MAG: DUF6178 family protein [Desulfobacterota bacterium]|nr:DUF6178 family protein [Thermodesulfobacteriota bacterium]